ncbi:hypothetical protein [Streptomyces sp. bgisy154]|uniref:hypothetical protein n=1 Tax=Streptomyces sp. bgisy154 TaxID=3413794 RepID=UPI003D75414A
MPRGRHRHSPPLHRLLPPSAIAGVSLICAFGPWVFSETGVLRVVAAIAAATAVVGAAVMRRWDTQAGKQVADLTRARASDEWRFEERVAELETDLEESRELRTKLEQRLRAKRAELAGLRNEHAALLRRYATAETERASALEGRRRLEIEATVPARELTPAPAGGLGARTGETAKDREERREETRETLEAGKAATQETDPAAATAGKAAAVAAEADSEADSEPDPESETPAVFSPQGSRLFLRAQEALSRLDPDKNPERSPAGPRTAVDAPAGREDAYPHTTGQETSGRDTIGQGTAARDGAGQEDEAQGKPGAVDEHARATAMNQDVQDDEGAQDDNGAQDDKGGKGAASRQGDAVTSPAPPVASTAVAPRPAAPQQRPAGHFTVPTAVAVVPAAQPPRRPADEGGFDFFGTKKAPASDALDAVQNEDLADVVGPEALALHKAEAESAYKPADAESRGIGQVIDLTAHDETEHIDVQRLRSAAS